MSKNKVEFTISKELSVEIAETVQELGLQQTDFWRDAIAVMLWAIERKRAGELIGSLAENEKGGTFREIKCPTFENVQNPSTRTN